MTDQSREPEIRRAFEDALVDGLKPQPIITKDGPAVDPVTKELLTGPPDAAHLSVTRAYLKDIAPSGDPKQPRTGQPRPGGPLDKFLSTPAGKGLPFQ